MKNISSSRKIKKLARSKRLMIPQYLAFLEVRRYANDICRLFFISSHFALESKYNVKINSFAELQELIRLDDNNNCVLTN